MKGGCERERGGRKEGVKSHKEKKRYSHFSKLTPFRIIDKKGGGRGDELQACSSDKRQH